LRYDFDLLIRNASVIIGDASPAIRADIGIVGSVIATIGSIPAEATSRDVIDATGLTVTPGFIDIHTHADIALLANPVHLPKVMQGVTTEVFTNCGLGFAPITDVGIQIQRRYIAGLFGDDGNSPTQGDGTTSAKRVSWSWRSVADLLTEYESAGIGTNVAYLIPHGSVRVSVMGMEERAADSGELERMRSMVAQGMEEGAWGISTGIWYAPMRSADRAELVCLFREAGLFATHQRDYGPQLFEATAESLAIAQEAGVPVQISHLQMNGPGNRGKAGELLAQLDDAIRSGIDVTCDTYPYTAGSTFIQSILPKSAAEEGPDQILKLLSNPETCSNIINYIDGLSNEWSEYNLVGATSRFNAAYEGLTFPEVAAARGLRISEWICAVLLEEDLRACFVHHGAHEENVRDILQWGPQMVGSDGLHLPGKTHPRLYGTFPRVLGYYVREEKVISLEQGIHKMTGAPAKRLGLKDRGWLREGLAADLVIVDTEKVLDTATFTEPLHFPDGIVHVFVNGTAVKRDGVATGVLAGRVLRKG